MDLDNYDLGASFCYTGQKHGVENLYGKIMWLIQYHNLPITKDSKFKAFRESLQGKYAWMNPDILIKDWFEEFKAELIRLDCPV